MQREPKQPTNDKTAKQLAVIVVLCIGLWMALATQPEKSIGDSPANVASTPEFAITPIALQEGSQGDQVALDPNQFQVTDLNRLPIELASRVDLFASVRASERSTKTVVQSGEALAKAIYGTHDLTQHSALIGNQIVRQGQGLSSGRSVAEILPSGIKVKSVQSP